ncbi:MAG: P-loop NTPase fold protein [Methylophilus sp.]|uniref:P-loop NTPase fold protein n=1 Tax=Methylophilus sp. TaxID=29541 RepID=UPI003FA00418
MSLKKAKDQLFELLSTNDCNVIALSGKWGTGKTHLWNEIDRDLTRGNNSPSLYVSLFGVSTIDEIKRKLLESAFPNVEGNEDVFSSFKNVLKVGIKAAAEHYKALAALTDINLLLLAPVYLKEKTIVIDDIERKNHKLEEDEVLGFIDEYSKRHGCRFILILNENRLGGNGGQNNLWATFREKVIDHEIKLNTSADEAFAIAISLVHSIYESELKRAFITCRLTNIRIIIKAIKVANHILGKQPLDPIIQARMIPSIVLFSAIYYKGVEDGPDFNFVLNIVRARVANLLNDSKEQSEDDLIKSRWSTLVHEMGIHSCDEFEFLLVDFLESGILEKSRFDEVITRYKNETNKLEANNKARKFLEDLYWNHFLSNEKLVSQSKKLVKLAGLLNATNVSEVVEYLEKLPGGEITAQKILKGWLENFKANPPIQTTFETTTYYHNNGIHLHPDISKAYQDLQATVKENTSIFDACLHIIDNNGWGSIQTFAFERSTVEEFDKTIRTLSIKNLRLFMAQMIDMSIKRQTFDRHFANGINNFLIACKNISEDQKSPRLATLIKNIFNSTPLAHDFGIQKTER